MPILLLLLFSQLSLLLNGTQPTSLYEGGSNGYDRGYHRLWEAAEYPSSSYSDPWILPTQDSPFAYDYVFHEPDPLDQENGRFVHCVRSVDLGPTDTENLYLRRTIFSDDARVTVWDDNGFYMDRDVDQNAGGSAFDYLPFYPGESDSLMKFVEEESYAAQTLKHQGIQLWKGWNLVSFNVLDDPVPENMYYINEIFGPPWVPEDSWFAWNYMETEGPDKVYEYRYGPQSDVYFPRTNTGQPTWSWLWDMTWAYMVYLDDQHLLELSNADWYAEGSVSFTPSSAWDDSLDDAGLPQQYIDNVNYWFFLGFSKSRQVEVLPANEASGPFFDLYDHTGTNYGNQTLKVVKSDDGRCFFPNSPYGDIDRIGFLEPGRGYDLGFAQGSPVSDWPFCDDVPGEESLGDGPQGKDETNSGIASAPDPVHFQFKPRSQWWYPIMIDTLAIEGVIPESGDEIGVLDGSICVGAAVYTDEMPLVIAAWKDDLATPTSLDGYEVGNEMIFKYFDQSENTEIIFELPPQTQSVPEEDPCVPRHSGFGMGVYALRSLAGAGSAVQQLPQEYSLSQNYPNPFNAQTVITLALPQRSRITAELFNLRGQNLGTIYEGMQNAGTIQIHYDGSNLSSGVYFLRATCEGLERGGSYTGACKLVLLK